MKITTYPRLNSFSDDGYCANLRLIVNIYLRGEDMDYEVEEFTNEDTGEYMDMDELTEEQIKEMDKFFDRLQDEWYPELQQNAAERAMMRAEATEDH